MIQPPSGTVTFLFTDIEGSTVRWEAYSQQMRAALARHDEIVRASIEEQGGYVFKTVGDAFCSAFASAHAALLCCTGAAYTLHRRVALRNRAFASASRLAHGCGR